MTEYPCAKINLGLNIVDKRPDGYHNLETVFYPINLKDKISIETTVNHDMPKKPCRLKKNGINIGGDDDKNLVVKAYNILKENCPSLPPIVLELTKNIPTQAGLGGGSSDCAFTITMLNRLFSLGMTTERMQILAAGLGADCAFFINPQPAYATGIGDKLEPVRVDLSEYSIVIVKPDIPISTKEAFSGIKPRRPKKCCREIVMQPVCTWKDELINDFEESIIPVHKEISDIKNALYDMGALYASMSGSGSALYGIFKDRPSGIEQRFNNCFTKIL